MVDADKIEMLEDKARAIRLTVLNMIAEAGKGHIGGAYSCTDIIVALYYGGILRFAPDNPSWGLRDRFILSKGHSGSALFAVLADLGYFDTSELALYCKNGSILGGHPDRNVPGIEADTGSLGHGLGIGAGMALAAKLNNTGQRVFVLVGDGECAEGAVWEAMVFAARHKLANLTLIIDRNRQCVLDFTEDCAPLDPFSDKLAAFGWDTREINGHSFEEILAVLEEPVAIVEDRPRAIVANTVKGKGVSFMEGILKWHHAVPNQDELFAARTELAQQTNYQAS
ncbi:MAG: transketolase [Desulfuromonadaceae bacterium]|nr:transketolase [Desulfuromonadaceae bacterium]MDD5104198.1 transketolase [Desulfuromonadaceae bacterium]